MPWFGWLILGCVVLVIVGGVVIASIFVRAFRSMGDVDSNINRPPVRAPRPRGWDRR